LGFRLARLFLKPIPSRPLSILLEMLPEITSGSPSDRLSTGLLVNAPLETSESVGMASLGSPGCLLQ